MASAIVGALRVVLSLDSAEFDTAMKRVSSSANAWGNDLTSMGRQATAVGSALTRTLTLPLVGLGLAAVKSASDFESSFAGVRKTVDATEPEFAALAQGLRDMAKEIPVNVNELNKVAESAGQLGIKKDDIIAFTRTMADLGVTTNLTADEAATATAQIQNIFGAAGKDVDRFGSTLVALGNAGASTEKDIIEMGKRIAGAGHQVGLTQAQVLSFASALSSVGINAEAGGSAISRVFLKINDAVAKGGADMAEFARVSGMTAAEFKQAWEKDAASATTAFISGLGRLKSEGENVNATIEGLVGKNIILKDTLLRASGAGQLLTEQLAIGNKAWQENTALTDEAGKRYGTFESQVLTLKNQLQDVAITFGNALLPMLKAANSAIKDLVPILDHMAKGFAGLPVPVQVLAVGFAGLIAAAGPAIWIFGQLVLAAGTVIKAFTAKGIAMRAITAVMESVGVSAGGLGKGVGALSGVFGTLTGAIGVVARVLTGPVGIALTAVDLSIRALTGNAHSLFSIVSDMATVLGDALVRGLSSAWDWLKKFSGTVTNFVTSFGKDFLQFLRDWVPGFAAIEKAINFVIDKLDRMAEMMGLVTKEGAKFWAEQAEHVRTTREVEKWVGKTAESLSEQARKTKDAFFATDLLSGANRVLAEEYKRVEEQSKRNAASTAAAALSAKELAAAEKQRADSAKVHHALEGKIADENEKFRAQAIAGVEKEKEAWRDYYNWLGERRMEEDARKVPLVSTWIPPLTKFKDAVTATGTDAVLSFDSISAAVKNMGNTILGALQGGGSIIKSIGSSMGSALASDFVENFGAKVTNLFGKTLGGALNAVLPGIGALLGPALEKIGSGLKKAFGIGINEEVKKANGEIEKLRQGLLATHGNMETLEARANAVGLSFQAAWGHQGQAGLIAFQGLMEDFEQRWADNEAAVAALNGELNTTQGELDGLIGKARDLGYEFGQNGEFIGVSFDTVKAKAEEFGVSVDGLGARFRQQGIDAEASRIINGFTLLSKAGGDVGGILVGMKDEIGKVVGQSIKFGTTIPKNMEPWILELMRTDQLIDENGVKITDLSQIKFGEPVATEFEKIALALKDVVQKLADILAAIALIPEKKTFRIEKEYHDPGPPQGWDDGGGGGGGRGSTERDGPGTATGTMGRFGAWFKDWGIESANTMHGIEAVVTPQQAPAFAMDVLSNMGGGSSSGGGEMAALLAEMQGLRRDMLTTIPAVAENAARHGSQTAGRRR